MRDPDEDAVMKPTVTPRPGPVARAVLTLVGRSKGWLTYECVDRAEGDVYKVMVRDRGSAPVKVALTVEETQRSRGPCPRTR